MAQADWITYGTPGGAKAQQIEQLKQLFANIGPVGTAQRSRWEVQGDQGANVAYDGHFNENFARQLLQMGLFADRFKKGALEQYQSGALDPAQLFSQGWYDLTPIYGNAVYDSVFAGDNGYQQVLRDLGAPTGYMFTLPAQADPEREGKKGAYTLSFNPDGTIKDVTWTNYNLSKGFLGDNMSWLGPLLVGGAAALGATAGGAAAGSAGSAGAGGGAAGTPYSLSSGMQSLGFQAPGGGSLLGGGGGMGAGAGAGAYVPANYSLAQGVGSGLGFQAPAGAAQMIAPNVGATVGAGGVNTLGYNLASMGGGQGIQLGAPNLTSMGGGQGIVAPGFTQMTTPETLWPIGGGAAAAPGTAGSNLLSAAGTGKTVMDLLGGAGSLLGPIAGLIAGDGALDAVRDLERQQAQAAQTINIRGPGMAPGARGMQPGGRPLIELLGRNRKANKNATDLTGGAGGGSRIGGNTLLGL